MVAITGSRFTSIGGYIFFIQKFKVMGVEVGSSAE
jgi:hypothetical protein